MQESSLQPNSFEDSSLEDSSFQEASLDRASFQRTTLTTELSQLDSFQESSLRASTFQEDSLANKSFPRIASTTELSQLQRQTSSIELAELERPTLNTELAQLVCKQSPALSLELTTAHLWGKLSIFLGGSSFQTICFRGGVLSRSLPQTSLTLDELELVSILVMAQVLPASSLPKRSFSQHLSRFSLLRKSHYLSGFKKALRGVFCRST